MSSLLEKREKAQEELKELASAFEVKQKEINLAIQQRDQIQAVFNQKQGSLQTLNQLISEATNPDEEGEACPAPDALSQA